MRIGVGFVALWAVLVATATQAELYRYIDGNGVVALDRHGVPAELIGRGYEVLNEQGRVIRVVPPAPTADERQRAQNEQQRAALDAQLLRLYSSLDDVERARRRKLSELDGLIGIAEGNLQALQLQQERLEQNDSPRAGEPQLRAERLRADQANLRQQLADYHERRRQADAGFARDRARLGELLGEAR